MLKQNRKDLVLTQKDSKRHSPLIKKNHCPVQAVISLMLLLTLCLRSQNHSQEKDLATDSSQSMKGSKTTPCSTLSSNQVQEVTQLLSTKIL